MLDDQAIVASVSGHGLVVLIGCGHSGVVNNLVPTPRTGWRATHALADRFPEAFIQNCVGTRFEFGGAQS